MLRESRMKPVVLVKSDLRTQFAPTFQWTFWRAHEGGLTAESDRSVIVELIDSILQRKLKSMEVSPQDASAQFLSAMHRACVGKPAVDIDEQTFKARFGQQSLRGGSRELKGAPFPIGDVCCHCRAASLGQGLPQCSLQCWCVAEEVSAGLRQFRKRINCASSSVLPSAKSTVGDSGGAPPGAG